MSLASRISALASRVGLEVRPRSTPPIPALARAWVCFGYVGTQVVVRASHNVASVTRTAAGRYRVTFAVAMPDANYCWTALPAAAPTAARSALPSCDPAPTRRPLSTSTSVAPPRLHRSTTPPKSTSRCTADGLHQAHLDALEAALVKGEKRVTFGDKTVEYRSVDELQAAIGAVKRDLFEQAVDTGLWPGAPRQIRVTTGKGF